MKMTASDSRIKHWLLLTGMIGAGVFTASWLTRRFWQPSLDSVGPAHNELLRFGGQLLSQLTSPTALIIVSLISAFLAVESHHVYAWLHISAGLAAAVLSSFLLKDLFAISRPTDARMVLQAFSTYGFPSTHATAAVTLLSLGCFHLHRLETLYRGWITSAGVITVFGVLGSRLILGVHSISDVIAGAALGAIVAAGSVLVWLHCQEKIISK